MNTTMSLAEGQQYFRDTIKAHLQSYVGTTITPTSLSEIQATTQQKVNDVFTNLLQATGSTFSGTIKLRLDRVQKNKITSADLWTTLVMIGKPVLLFDNSMTSYTDEDGTYTWVNDELYLEPTKQYLEKHPWLCYVPDNVNPTEVFNGPN